MNGRDQHAAGHSDAFVGVIVLLANAPRRYLEYLLEDHDQPRRVREVLLDLVGAQRSERVQPFARHAAVVVLILFRLRSLANFRLQSRIVDRNEAPGLPMGTRRGSAGGFDNELDQLARYRLAGEMTSRATRIHLGIMRTRAPDHLGRR